MLAPVRSSSFRRATSLALLTSAAFAFGSCATKQEPQLVSDGITGRESSLPWNKQEKWENTGQLGAMAEHVESR